MTTPLAVLLVEDCVSDAELILRCLRRADFEPECERVESEPQLLAALRRRSWDVVLSDFNLPGFSASAALARMRGLGLDLPFIVVSGNIGEETAVALMKSGAHDYVMKADLARLAPAVKREINEAAQRREHRRAADALRQSEERWSFALEGAGYGVWDWDVDSGQVLFSECWMAMHGFAAGEIEASMAGRERLIHPDDLARVREALREHLNGTTRRYKNEHRALCKDGSWKWVLDNGMIVSRDPNGAPLRMICTHVDLSDRKRAEDALRELNEQLESRVDERTRELRQAMAQIIESEKLASLGALVAGVSHELNTPIGNMVLAASALGDQLRDIGYAVDAGKLTRSGMAQLLAECRDASDIIVRNGNRASDLIDSFKRVSVDQTSQRRRRFDLRTTVQDSLNALGAVTRRAKATVELRIPDGIEMDSFPGHLEQIVNNIIMNSITHGFEGKSGGRIELAASVQDGVIELHYRDDGQGIARALQHKVFEPFYTTKLGQGGSGLGLSIVHNLVQAIFKGRLRLESDSGQGVQLFFTFPAVTPQ
ncbi:PAS domain S-box-containing protein [Janthinobacterium sp. CG_23.3]|uniref:hybrid sensor histidine kinase/response regulator n=1 Tax=unclassified Janthinobacterium TaxID=2610881 RepID=UPI00034D1D45|nr:MULTISPECIES: ATP-binding protein [unclassified Janthinobacterium]MEC5160265.1 PAS domain S-box-containing protein [Janthinobacterium sp. CG_S6]